MCATHACSSCSMLFVQQSRHEPSSAHSGPADRSSAWSSICSSLCFLLPTGLCDWNNTVVIFVWWVVSQLSYGHVTLHVARIDLPSLSGSSLIYWIKCDTLHNSRGQSDQHGAFYELHYAEMLLASTILQARLGSKLSGRESGWVGLVAWVSGQWRRLMNRKWRGRSVPRGACGWAGEGMEKRGHVDPLVVQHPSRTPHPGPGSLRVHSGCVHREGRRIISNISIWFPYLCSKGDYIIKGWSQTWKIKHYCFCSYQLNFFFLIQSTK